MDKGKRVENIANTFSQKKDVKLEAKEDISTDQSNRFSHKDIGDAKNLEGIKSSAD